MTKPLLKILLEKLSTAPLGSTEFSDICAQIQNEVVQQKQAQLEKEAELASNPKPKAEKKVLTAKCWSCDAIGKFDRKTGLTSQIPPAPTPKKVKSKKTAKTPK